MKNRVRGCILVKFGDRRGRQRPPLLQLAEEEKKKRMGSGGRRKRKERKEKKKGKWVGLIFFLVGLFLIFGWARRSDPCFILVGFE